MPEPSTFEQFDQAIDAIFAGTAPESRGLEPMLAIARELRDLPRPHFKTRLRAELERTSSMATVAQRTPHVQTATPRLRLRNVAAAIDFYQKAFGAEEVMRFEAGGQIPYAELQIGNARFSLGEASPDEGYPGPETLGGSPIGMSLMVEDCRAAVERAVAAGGKLTSPISDQFYGDRVGQVLDPFGYTWAIEQRLEEISIEEMHRRFGAMMSEAPQKQAGASPVPKGYRTVTPYLVAENAAGLIEFVKNTFGAEETFRAIGPAGGIHAEVRLDDSMLMIGGGGPGLNWRGDAMPAALHVYVKDVDAAHARALAAGAVNLQPPADQEYGERGGSVKDPAGNHWYIATAKGPHYIAEGVHNLNVYLHPLRGEPVIAFLKKAFGAREEARHATPDGIIHHARVRIGDSVVEMGEAHGPYQPMRSMFYLYVPNVDQLYQRALNAGAASLSAPADQPYGDRTAGVKDMFGNQWYLATHFKDMTP